MSDVIIHRATEADVPAMAELRERSGWPGGASATWMAHYLKGEHHPREALALRIAFVAADGQDVVGYIFGHLTRRLDCQGELQWFLVDPAARGGPTATQLWSHLRDWFLAQGACRICVNVEVSNLPACRFYARMGAAELGSQWMIWSDLATQLPSIRR
jgi:GNAT superfamily N-acetyltransferase